MSMPQTCPVCRKDTYSRGGIHPQCVEKQEDDNFDAIRRAVKKGDKKAPASHVPSFTLKAWHKQCPKCWTQIHVRKMTCDCGFSFDDDTLHREE